MNKKFDLPLSVSNLIFAIVVLTANLPAQSRPGQAPAVEPSIFESFGLWAGLAAVAGLIGLAVFMRKKKEAPADPKISGKADEGLRMTYKENSEKASPKKPEPVKPRAERGPKPASATLTNTFTRLQRTNPYIQLPESTDAALLTAIEQTGEDSEEDVQVRTQALKLLATFKNSNAVTAIAQVALYDLSSKMRSDAVGVLSEFDHESVFETVVTACADPTREVRAAAAKALFKLSFDRGHSWTRIIESGDMSRMRHAARCAIEGDLVERSLDRIVHPDRKVAYEIFALVALLIKAGETEPVYKALARHKDENVKLAILNVLQVMKEEHTFDDLSDLLNESELTPNVAAKVNEIRSMLQMSHA